MFAYDASGRSDIYVCMISQNSLVISYFFGKRIPGSHINIFVCHCNKFYTFVPGRLCSFI